LDLRQQIALGAAALVAGMVNSIAGGGTLISFPAAVAAGLPPIWANATNSVALTPASLTAAWGFRSEVKRHGRLALSLLGPGMAGGLVGAVILRNTPQRVFDAIVPWLVLGATLLILAQKLIVARSRSQGDERAHKSRLGFILFAQFLVGVYGGYFGAAMGIVMLGMYSLMRELEIHAANGIKNVISGSINCIASIYFIASGIIDYRAAALMAVCASSGGFIGARLTRRIPAAAARALVVAIGFSFTALLAYRHYGRP
jgi:uncharacterized membrane protein YfcA